MYLFTGLPRVVEHFEVGGGVRTGGAQGRGMRTAVSYTHLTLPTTERV